MRREGIGSGKRRAVRGMVLVLGATLALWGTSSGSASAAGCANEAIRAEQASTFLPDCRAYEMVSPVGAKPTLSSDQTASVVQASESGDALAWFSHTPLAGESNNYGETFRSVRGVDGWSTENAMPPQSTSATPLLDCNGGMEFSADLAKGVLEDGMDSDGLEQSHQNNRGEYQFCGSNDPPLVEGEPEGFQNLFLRDFDASSWRLIDVTPAGVMPVDAFFEGASRDFTHVVFSEEAKLTPEAPGGYDLYEWAAGAVHLITYLPDGTPVQGHMANGHIAPETPAGSSPSGFTDAVSADASRIVFAYEGKLFVRENADQPQSSVGPSDECLEPKMACTVQIDASQAGGLGGGGKFLWANAEGTRVFFADAAGVELTGNTQPGSGANLYEYELPAGASSGTLVDLTPYAEADVLGISGVSEDGGKVYFAAEGAFEAPGATAGEPNLFMLEDEAKGAKPAFIATVERRPVYESHPWAEASASVSSIFESFGHLAARVSPNGRYFAFDSTKQLTGVDNTDARTGEPDEEIFLYDSVERKLSCVSCGSAAPVGSVRIATAEDGNALPFAPGRLQRQLLDDGTVFFETPTALVRGDSNGTWDAYEYRDGGQHLLSSGVSAEGAHFLEASADGHDVFFATSAALVGADADNGLSVYDAREGGGFPEGPAAGTGCSGEECRAAVPGAPVFAEPASVTFTGPGNLPAARAHPHKGKGRGGEAARRRKLERALRRCAHRFRHSRHKRRLCKRRVHRRYRANGARVRRHRPHRHGGAK